MRLALLIFGLFWAATARAQAIEVSAGSSTLFGATGGGASAYFPTQTVSLFGGVAGNNPVVGFSDSFKYQDYNLTLGDRLLGFAFDGTGLSTINRGVTVERDSNSEQFIVFAGGTGLAYYEPFFQAADARHFGAGFFGRKKAHSWELSSLEVISGNKKTAAQGFTYRHKIFQLQGSGGILNNARFLNGFGDLEPASWIHFTAAHQSYFWPTKSTFDSLSAYTSFGHFTAQASILDGATTQGRLLGESIGAGAHWNGFSEHSDFYTSKQQRFLTHTIAENFRRIGFTQVVTTSAGKTNVAFGGSLHTNSVSVSVSYSVLFFAARGFQQVTTIQISFRLPRTDAAVSLATNLGPEGVPKYTASATDFFYGNSGLFAGSSQPRSVGKYSVCGTVKEPSGEPVSGAALRIGKVLLFTDTRGQFTFRSRKRGNLPLVILTAEFLLGDWNVVEAPVFVTVEAEGEPIHVVVRKKMEALQK